MLIFFKKKLEDLTKVLPNVVGENTAIKAYSLC